MLSVRRWHAFRTGPVVRGRAGTVLSYTVTLTNPTAQPISLQPCPGYWAHGFFHGESMVHDQLNCDGHTAIGSKARVTFAM